MDQFQYENACVPGHIRDTKRIVTESREEERNKGKGENPRCYWSLLTCDVKSEMAKENGIVVYSNIVMPYAGHHSSSAD